MFGLNVGFDGEISIFNNNNNNYNNNNNKQFLYSAFPINF